MYKAIGYDKKAGIMHVWDDDGTAVNLTMTVQPDYCVLNF